MPKRPYSPDQSVKFRASVVSGSEVSHFSQVKSEAKENRKVEDQPHGINNFPVDSSARSFSTFDCSKSGLCSSAYKMAGCQQDGAVQQIQSYDQGKVHLDFDDFYCLMKLKIGY